MTLPSTISSVDQICLLAAKYVRDDFLNVIRGAAVFFNGIGMIACFGLLYLLIRQTVFHVNMRTQLASMLIAMLIYIVQAQTRYAQTFLLAISATDDCDMAPTDQTCRFLSFARNLPFLVIKSCMLTLALERIYATWHYSTYEQSRATLVNVLLTIIAWLPVLAILLLIYDPGTSQLTTFCIGAKNGGFIMSKTMAYVTLGEQILIVIIVIVLAKINARKRRLHYFVFTNVSTIYQLKENLLATRIIFPVALVHVAIHFIQIGQWLTSSYSDLWDNHGTQHWMVFSNEMVGLSRAAYNFVVPLLIVVRCRPYRRAVFFWTKNSDGRRYLAQGPRKILSPSERYRIDLKLTGTISDQQNHFQLLQKAWQ